MEVEYLNSKVTVYSPPHHPWQEIAAADDAGGYLSYYYSDDLSRLPVRAVTKLGDNKADPNPETGTYGLFSTCGPMLRSSFVKQKKRYVFFITRRTSGRVLAGYYRVRWFAPVKSSKTNDFALAADKIRFDANPLSLEKIDRLLGTTLSTWFRVMRTLSSKECVELCRLLDGRPDATRAYLEEIDRLERFNLAHGGSRYLGRQRLEPFSWQEAEKFLIEEHPSVQEVAVNNSSPTDWWLCAACGEHSKNKARLRECPHCKEVGTLQPQLRPV